MTSPLGPVSARIVGAGATTPLGQRSLSLAMAVRAGITQRGVTVVEDTASLRDAGAREVVPNEVPVEATTLDPSLTGMARLVALADQVFVEACANLPVPDDGYPVVLAVPPPERHGAAWDGPALLSTFAAGASLRVNRRLSTVVAGESTAGVEAMARALAWIGRGHSRVVVIGVDSFSSPTAIAQLHATGRITPEQEGDRYFAEGAGALVLDGESRAPASAVVEHASVATIPDHVVVLPREAPNPSTVTGAARRAATRRLGFQRDPHDPRDIASTDTLATLIDEAIRGRDASSCLTLTDADVAPARALEWAEVAVRSLPRGCPILPTPFATGDLGAATVAVWGAIWARWAEAGCTSAGLGIFCAHGGARQRGVVTFRATTFSGRSTP
jgi:hypothetical protein